MQAIVMTAPGPASALELQEVSEPLIHHGHEVKVRLKAAGVNPVDTKLRSRGTYFPDRLPTILGCDGAGVVEQIGSKVTRFAVGDEVYFCYGGIGGHPGNYAQYNVVDEHLLAHKPATLSFAQAAAAPLVLITAWEALFDRAGIEAGQTVLIHAGAGGVGHVAIQLARIAGCRVITTVSDESKALLVRHLGADEVINYRHEDLLSRVATIAPGGVDVVLDAVGGTVMGSSVELLRPYGHLVTLLQPDEYMNWKLARMKNIQFSMTLMLSPMYYGWREALAHQVEILEQCARYMMDGRLHIELAAELPLEQAAKAHERIEAGGMSGKLVLAVP